MKATKFILWLLLAWLATLSTGQAKRYALPGAPTEGPNLYAYVKQNPWTEFDPDGLFANTDLDAGEWFRAVITGAGQGAMDYGKNVIKAPYTVGQGVVSGYQQIGELGGDVLTGNTGVGTMAHNPGATLQATGQVALDALKQAAQSFSTPAGLGQNAGSFLLLGSLSAGLKTPVPDSPPVLAPVETSARAIAEQNAKLIGEAETKVTKNTGDISPDIKPSEVAGKTPAEIDALAKQRGLVPKGPDPMSGKGSYDDPVTGEQRILSHPDAESGSHAHVNDPQGNRLDINGNKVDNDTPEAHLPISAGQ